MALAAGVRLGPYEILGPLGAGGMGEVYKALDTRLDRTVAIKVLAPSLAGDPIFRERFDREARTISSLDHPHICVLHDVGRVGDVEYLVMQFLDGETLAARLERGPLPVALALDYASQIAAALDRAHRAGIVHRDLKPGNVMLARAGSGSSTSVKLLDFGLAKAPALAGAAPSAARTMTTPLTGQGTIVGTLQYMAPEQLEGRDIDARTDIFALGAILYEMLTARRPFDAASQAGVMAAILEKEPPPLSAVQPLMPPGLDRIVQRCLSKDPEARWQSAADLAAALSWLRADSGVAVASASVRPVSRRAWFAAAAVAATLLLTGLVAVGWLTRQAPRAPSLHARLMPPAFDVAVPEISPDGRMVVWSGATSDNKLPLWLQPLDSDSGRAIPGTEGAIFAFWSPDGRDVAFFSEQKLRRIAIAGGAPTIICEVPDTEPRGGSWGSDGMIVFSGGRTGALSRVAATGGTPKPLTALDKTSGFTTHRWPQLLPDGRHVLYLASPNDGPNTRDAIVFTSVDGRESHVVLRVSSNPVFADGRLLFVDKGRLVAQPFDPEKGTVSGDATPIMDDVPVGYGVTRAMFSAVGAVLVATPNGASRPHFTLDWITPGRAVQPAGDGSAYDGHAWLSPDGRRSVVTIDEARSGQPAIWTIDYGSGTRTRLTLGNERWTPVWSPDGSKVFYAGHHHGDEVNLYSKAIGDGDEVVVSRNIPIETEVGDCSAEYLRDRGVAAGSRHQLRRAVGAAVRRRRPTGCGYRGRRSRSAAFA